MVEDESMVPGRSIRFEAVSQIIGVSIRQLCPRLKHMLNAIDAQSTYLHVVVDLGKLGGGFEVPRGRWNVRPVSGLWPINVRIGLVTSAHAWGQC